MKYWVYLNGEVPGSYEPEELVRVPGFSNGTIVCPVGGEGPDRNWQRAALFPDIAQALERRFTPKPAPPVDPPSTAAASVHPSEDLHPIPLAPADILNSTSEKLFRHVTELMKELENRREERSLVQSMERNLREIKSELQAARERIRFLEDRASLIPGFEDREQKLQELLHRARADLKEKSDGLESVRRDFQDMTAALSRANADKERLARLADELNRRLAEKELALARSLSVLQRLEAEMGQILPQSLAGVRPPALPPPPLPDKSTAPMPSAPTPILEAKPPPASPLPDIPTLKPKPQSPASISPFAKFKKKDAPAAGPAPAPSSRNPFTVDEGRPSAPVRLPPEGVMAPVTPPWMKALKRFLGSLVSKNTKS